MGHTGYLALKNIHLDNLENFIPYIRKNYYYELKEDIEKFLCDEIEDNYHFLDIAIHNFNNSIGSNTELLYKAYTNSDYNQHIHHIPVLNYNKEYDMLMADIELINHVKPIVKKYIRKIKLNNINYT